MMFLWYMNEETGEITENHWEAVEWFNEGVNVTLIKYQEPIRQWVQVCTWEH